ncbi:MAG: 16S rRNA (cytosine(1402)-N(4))-methyltransferase RsmH [Caldimicrobium sp.]
MREEGLYHHEPVLPEEVLYWLRVERDKIYVDGTLGLGGHTKAILERGAPTTKVYAFEWNEDTLQLARERLKDYGDRIKIIPKNFIYIKAEMEKEGILVDGVLLDLGLSSFLLEGSGRGFSFQKDEPLDMRMSLELELTAGHILNTFSEEELRRILTNGEVPKAKALAQFLVKKRKRSPFKTTFDLVSAIKEFYRPPKKKEKDLLALVFQALRIEVNQELENLNRALRDIPDIIKPYGRFVVISFHSLEDRLVKRAFKEDPRLLVLTKKPIVPSLEEVRRNPRARSAKMRVAERREFNGR